MDYIDVLVNSKIAHINIWKTDDERRPICVEFEGAYVKEGVTLKGEFGTGETVDCASLDYIRKINNKTLVFYPDGNRKEIKLVFTGMGVK